MANEIEVSYIAAKTVYSLVRNSIGQIWNGATFEAYATANYANYVVQMTEQGTASAFYTGTFPAAIGAGVYNIVAHVQIGGSPLETDPTVGVGDLEWSGTIVLPLSNLATSGQVASNGPVKIYRGEMVTNFPIYLKSSADHITPFTSGICSGQISRDGGSFVALQSGAFTEMGLGFYRTTLTSGDITCNTAALLFTATGISGGTSDPAPMALILQRSTSSGSA